MSLKRIAILICVACLYVSASAQPTIVQSNFDTGTETWQAFTVTNGICTATLGPRTNRPVLWEATGGATGGFLRHTNHPGSSYFRAPSSFRGNLTSAAGGAIVMQRRLTTTSTDLFQRWEDVIIEGPAGTLLGMLPRPRMGEWTEQRLELIRGFWRWNACHGPVASDEQIASVLANVTDILISAEYTPGTQTNDLDSIALVGPSSGNVCTLAWQLTDDAVPTGRWRHAMAVDSHRNVLVLFGGETGETDTWEFDLATQSWTKRISSLTPARRGGHAMAYDSARQRIVLSGGGYLGNAFNDVWEYSTATGQWSLSTPMPEARSGHSMAYDSDRNVMVVYGGLAAGQSNSTAVLERGPTAAEWTVRQAALNPDVLFGHAMCYFPGVRNGNGKMIAVESQIGNTVRLWEWDGVMGTWELRSVTGTPPAARTDMTLTFDPVRSRAVLISGVNIPDTWEYDGTAWLRRLDLPAGDERHDHAAAFDPVGSRILVYGGLIEDQSPARSMLAFRGNSNTWSSVFSEDSPSARWSTSAVFDETGSRVILHGGALVTRPGLTIRVGSGTFEFRGTSWNSLAVQWPSNGFAARNTAHAYIPGRRSLLFYGGRGLSDSTLRNVWEFDIALNRWFDRTPDLTTPPGQRAFHAAAYDRIRGEFVVFGGASESGIRRGDTWTYNPSSGVWQQRALTGPTPGIRVDHAMAFDEARGVVVLFGGIDSVSGSELTDATWQWNGSEWSRTTIQGARPRARRLPAMWYDSARGEVCLAGGNMHLGSTNAPQLDDVWTFNGTRWAPLRQVGTLPTTRWLSSVVFDRSANKIVHFGGASVQNQDYTSEQTWFGAITCEVLCDSIDFNQNTVFPEDQDVIDFFNVLAGGECSPGNTCNDIDFNNNGAFPEDQDVIDFFTVLSGGECS